MDALKVGGPALRQELYTPPIIIEAARDSMGSIDLDVASCSEANEVVQAAQYLTKSDDGLNAEWEGNVWCNPPFRGGQVRDWYSKVFHHEGPGCILMPHSNAKHVIHALHTADAVCWLGACPFPGWWGPAIMGYQRRGVSIAMPLLVAMFRCSPSPLWENVGPIR